MDTSPLFTAEAMFGCVEFFGRPPSPILFLVHMHRIAIKKNRNAVYMYHNAVIY